MVVIGLDGNRVNDFTTDWAESFETAYKCTVVMSAGKKRKIELIEVTQKVGSGELSWQAKRNDARFEEAKKILEQVLNMDKRIRNLLPRKVQNW